MEWKEIERDIHKREWYELHRKKSSECKFSEGNVPNWSESNNDNNEHGDRTINHRMETHSTHI